MTTTSTNTRTRASSYILLLTVAVVLLAFVLPQAGAWLQYDRSAIAQGEWWRIITSHLTHWTGSHLLWDLIMFIALAVIALRISKPRTFGTLLLSAVLIPTAVWIFRPHMIHYRGLSGLDSALYVFVLLELIKKQSTKTKSAALWMMLISFTAKVAYEFMTGNTLFVQSMGPNISGVPLAHLVGGITGAIFARGKVGSDLNCTSVSHSSVHNPACIVYRCQVNSV
jgi:rhomboid family GlyGly-CTERM serine protease